MSEAGLLLILKKLNYIHFIVIFYFQLLTSVIVRKMDWAKWGAAQVAKIGGKMALNALIPGSGSVMEFAEAVNCYRNGDACGCAISTVSGFADLCSFGLAGATKQAMTESAKKSVVQLAKESAKTGSKEASKKLGQQVGKELAKGVLFSSVEEVWYKGTKMTVENFVKQTGLSAISSGGHEVVKTIVGDWLEIVITESVKGKPLVIVYELTKEAAIKGAEEEFKRQSYKFLAKDVTASVVKGGIRFNQSDIRK